MAHKLREIPTDLPAAFGENAMVLGGSMAFLRSLMDLFWVGPHEITVLIQGESGTGKELFSRAIHNISPKRHRPFVAINCAALPKDLLESEVFGHVRGAFSGAETEKPGLVEAADGGTLFLDEIPSMDLSLQAKLLRFLDAGEFRRVGDHRSRRAKVRVVAASNVDLKSEVDHGRFRSDLYYRLNAFPLHLPPLRQRRQDIPALLEHFLERKSKDLGIDPPVPTDEALQALTRYDWPGNVRELENAVTQMVLRRAGRPVEVDDLPLPVIPAPETSAPILDLTDEELLAFPFASLKKKVVDRFEERYLRALLHRHAGNVTRAAEAAGKHRRALTQLLRKHAIDPRLFRKRAAPKRT